MNNQEKIQELYSLRNQLYNKIVDMTIIPEYVIEIIKDAFQQIGKWYGTQDWYKTQNLGITVNKDIEGFYEKTKADISTGQQSDRRGKYWGQIDNLFDTLEKKIEQGEELSQSEVEKFKIQDDESERANVVNFIVNELTEQLKEVQKSTINLMIHRGFSDEEIITANSKVEQYIEEYIRKNIGKKEIAEIYKKRENKLTNDVVIALTEIIKAINSSEITPQNDFKRDLNVTDELTYEQQNANSRGFLNKQQDKAPEEPELPSLPTDLIQ